MQRRTGAQDENHSVLTFRLKIQRCVGSVKQKAFIPPVVFEPHRHKHWKMHTRQVKTCEQTFWNEVVLSWISAGKKNIFTSAGLELVIRKRQRQCMKCRCVSLTQVILGFIGSALPLKGPWPLEILYCKNSVPSEASLAGRRRSRASI